MLSSPPSESPASPPLRASWLGVAIAGSIITAVLVSSGVLLYTDLSVWPLWSLPAIAISRAFLQTGLFITAHDAMHGTACPASPRLNHTIGRLALGLYSLLPYDRMRFKHYEHHAQPASDDDPDFCASAQNNPLLWFVRFMLSYQNKWTIIGVTLSFHAWHWLGGVPYANLLLFWFLPTVVSAYQLFYFGIFLPHREDEAGYSDRHRSRSLYVAPFWSFLACYHFGYHWEHHEYPNLPWYHLPTAVEPR